MMWTGVLSAAAPRRTSCSKRGTSAPGCWKAFCAESARYSSILRCAAARVAEVAGGAEGRLVFFLAGFFFVAGGFVVVVWGEPASRQQPTRAAPSARRIRLRITPV